MSYIIQFRMPAGVALRQDQTGLIRVTYDHAHIPAMRETFEKLRHDLLELAIKEARDRKEKEQKRQEIPATTLQRLDAEIHALEQQRT